MEKKTIIIIVAALFLGVNSHAEDLIPATSDDVSDFDKRINEQLDSEKRALQSNRDGVVKSADNAQARKDRKQNFGLIVSTEAKKLNEESKDKKKEMGKWVSSQRRQNTQTSAVGGTAGNASGSVSNGSSASADAKNSAPGLDGSAGNGSSTTRGNSGKDKK